ncbi:MAG: hypothetical protein IH616_12500, partial [Gemmatimonadales bacterium]|nr:hypothetical protein [Gemmatimonadales bacterium]
MKALLLTIVAASMLAGPAAVLGQEGEQDRTPSAGRALNIGSASAGLSIGNSHRWNGVRFNVIDRDVQLVNGLNVTFWTPKHNDDAVYNGVSVGVAPG